MIWNEMVSQSETHTHTNYTHKWLYYSVRKRTEKINPKIIFQIMSNDFLLIEDNSFCL